MQDESIQREEIKEVLRELSMEDSDEVVEALFKAVDKGRSFHTETNKSDHDGIISFEEFRQFVLLMPSLSMQTLFERWLTSSSLIDEPGAGAPQDKVCNLEKSQLTSSESLPVSTALLWRHSRCNFTFGYSSLRQT